VARTLGARAARILIVGCEPAQFDPASPLSAPVAAAIGPAAQLVCELCA
jgi:hydrogenase maturation protease